MLMKGFLAAVGDKKLKVNMTQVITIELLLPSTAQRHLSKPMHDSLKLQV